MTIDWFVSSWSDTVRTVLSAALVLGGVVAIIRVCGLRSLSKMSSFDFAVTVAIGSLIATTCATSTPISDGVIAVGALLGIQFGIAQFRRRSFGSRLVDNQPVLLMQDGVFLPDAMTAARVTQDDVYAKLREANVHQLHEVNAVVLETTGDISVLHGHDQLDPVLLTGVRRRAGDAAPDETRRE